MMIPTVHINGTSRRELLTQLSAATSALATALKALQEASPNARDYYPQGPEAFNQAAAEHASRYNALHTVLGELLAMYEALDQ